LFDKKKQEQVGNAEDAQLLEQMYRSNEQPPDGWKLVGSGAYRQVYLHPDGDVVYKVNRSKTYNANAEEYKAIERVRPMLKSSNVYIPKATLYDRVIAMEYIDLPEKQLWGSLNPEENERYVQARADASDAGIEDMHSKNVRWNDPVLVVFDLNMSHS
jgi:hypothetical protein